MKKWKNTDKVLSLIRPALAILFALLLWDVYVLVSGIDRWILPRPHEIAVELYASRALIGERMLETLGATGIGLGAAIIVSLVLATLMDASERVRATVYPLLVISQSIPYFVIAPLLIVWFGFGMTPKVLVVMLVCLFPLTVNMVDGYRQIDRDLLRMLQSMGATRNQIYKMVKWPGALPSFFSGLKIAGTYSVLGTVVSEMLGGNQGLGIMLIRSMKSFEVTRMFATIVVIVALSLAIYGAVQLLARLSMPYQRRET